MRDDLSDKGLPIGILFDQASNGCNGNIFCHAHQAGNFWSVAMENSLWRAKRIGVASDAHFRETHDIDALAHACLKVGTDGRQILINSTFFTVHLDEANLDGFHSKLLSLLELE